MNKFQQTQSQCRSVEKHCQTCTCGTSHRNVRANSIFIRNTLQDIDVERETVESVLKIMGHSQTTIRQTLDSTATGFLGMDKASQQRSGPPMSEIFRKDSSEASAILSPCESFDHTPKQMQLSPIIYHQFRCRAC